MRIKTIRFIFLALAMFMSLSLKSESSNVPPYIPVNKNIDSIWLHSILCDKIQKIYSGKDLKFIAMPCGGIGAGQVDISGEGNLCFEKSIFNLWQAANDGNRKNYSNGFRYMHPVAEKSEIENKFYIKIDDGKSMTYELNKNGFENMDFIGEYPIAKLNYKNTHDNFPLIISSEIFSPFVPLNVRYSANPITVVRFTIQNKANKSIIVSLGEWMQCKSFSVKSKGNIKSERFQYNKVRGFTMGNKFDEDSCIFRDSQYGNMSVGVNAKNVDVYLNVNQSEFLNILNNELKNNKNNAIQTDTSMNGNGITSNVRLKGKETKTVTFFISWYYPNQYEKAYNNSYVGHIYNNWYTNSCDVIKYVSKKYNELYTQTKLFNKTYFNTSIPYWLANRITMSASTLATGNTSIWENGRMYAYEGIGFCYGTCGHVYNFVTAISHLFPSLERSIRNMQDYNENFGFSKSGRINFRGHDSSNPSAPHAYASDAQSGYVLKAYREHLMSDNNEFINGIWDKIKKAIGYCIFKDGAEIGLEPNGVLENKQTFWDPMWYGPNPYNNTLYLAALRAAEEMAKYMNESKLAERYHSIYLKGVDYMNYYMWNGEYYIHLYPMGFSEYKSDNGARSIEEIENDAINYVDSLNNGNPFYYRSDCCDANQLFGQNWANQLNLGYLLPKDKCHIAAKSIFKYNWTPDISTVYTYEKPKNRILAAPGEAAMINGVWPNKKPKPFENTHDKSDVWTGLEYEAACDMINEGLIDEGFILLKSVDNRYNATKRNPWNEIEGSDHYSRAMHAWNVLLSLSGFFSNGPENIIKFTPQFNTAFFKSFFSTACGWGNIEHNETSNITNDILSLKYGTLKIKKIIILSREKSKKIHATINGNICNIRTNYNSHFCEILFDEIIDMKAGDILCIK